MTTSAGSGTENVPGAGQRAELLKIPLIPTVRGELQRLQERTGLSRTDIVNRAISAYAFLDAQLSAGHDLVIRNNSTGETQLVRFQ
jgi:hypothetical protein